MHSIYSLPILINLFGDLVWSGFPTRMRMAKHLAHICYWRYFYGWMNKIAAWQARGLNRWCIRTLCLLPKHEKQNNNKKLTCQLKYRYHSRKSACKFEFHFKNMISHYNFMNYLSFALSNFEKHPFLTIEKISSDYWLRINSIWESGGLKSIDLI